MYRSKLYFNLSLDGCICLVLTVVRYWLHVGVYSVPAEFVIHLADENPTFDAFKKALDDKGASFSVSCFLYDIQTQRA